MFISSSITGNFGFQPPSHSDILGSLLGTGIAREKLGDIILQVQYLVYLLHAYHYYGKYVKVLNGVA